MKIKSLVIAASLLGAVSTAAFADDASMAASNSDAQAAVDQMNQLTGFINSAGDDWTQYVTVHGGAFVDGHWGSLNQDRKGQDENRESVTDGYLAIEATPNDWMKFNTVINYSNSDDNYSAGQDTGTQVDQAYVTVGNFNSKPVYFQAGKQYIPFGNYDLYPIQKSYTQLLSQTNATDAQLGFVSQSGVYGSVYSFQGSVGDADNSDKTDDTYGATLGIKRENNNMTLNLVVGYIDNFDEVTMVADYINDQTTGYSDKVGGYSVHGSLSTGPIGLEANYVTAADESTDFNDANTDMQPWGSDVKASYNFALKGNDSQVFVGYGKSGDSEDLGLSESNYSVGYNVFPWDNTVFGLEVAKNTNYDDTNNGDDYYTIGLRAGVQF